MPRKIDTTQDNVYSFFVMSIVIVSYVYVLVSLIVDQKLRLRELKFYDSVGFISRYLFHAFIA